MSDMIEDAVQSPPVETPAPAAVESPAAAPAPDAEPAAPSTMLEAMDRVLSRDEKGRFTAKEQAEQAAAKVAAAAPAAAPGAPSAAAAAQAAPGDDDITKMPEGLGAKAQERFQKLANGIKEREAQLEEARSQLGYVQQTFQQHGVQREQFEAAVGVIGMLNRGDYRSALKVLDEQRRQIALQIGEPLPGVDVLADFPDLREKVNGLLMSEADAAHVASLRRQQQQHQQAQQQQRQQIELQQASQQAFAQGQAAVDAWAKRTAATDLDYPAIEKILLPKIGALLEGVPPSQWARIMQTQYELIKESGATFRRSSPSTAPTPDPLRPAGAGAGAPKPTSMFEAMFGSRPGA